MKARVWVLAIAAGVPLTACKATRRSDAPSLDVRGWSLAEIEAELQRNDEVLAREGIMVASASVPPTRDGAGPDADAGYEEQEAFDAEGEDDAGAPTVEAAEPGPAPEPMPEAEPAPTATADEPEHVDALEAQSRPGHNRRARASSRREPAPSRCERVCDLAEATCELETQICELAQRHPGEPRYARACARAEQQCLAAARACDRCDE